MTQNEFNQLKKMVNTPAKQPEEEKEKCYLIHPTKTFSDIKKEIAMQLKQEKEGREERERQLPKSHKNLSWQKLLNTKLFNNKH